MVIITRCLSKSNTKGDHATTNLSEIESDSLHTNSMNVSLD